MSSAARIVLARPHAFIVGEMKPFLARAGFAPQPAARLEELADLLRGARGAIISTAVISSIPADALKVFAEVRRVAPRVPVLFAGLTDVVMLKGAAQRVVRELHPQAEILSVAEAASHGRLGAADVFLVLRKEDLAADLAETALDVVRRHFR